MVGLSVAVVSFGAVGGPLLARADADPVGTAQAQQAQLQAQVISSANRIRALTDAYEQAETQATTLAAQVQADRARIGQLESQVASTRQALRIDAVMSYTGASSTTPGGVAGSGGLGGGAASVGSDPAIRAEYLEVAAGDVSDTVDRYRAQETQIAGAEQQLTAEMAASQAAARATETSRQEALALAASVQTQLQQVQTRITQLVAARAAAPAPAAAPAAAAAQAATQGLPVGGGLVSVVRNVVSPAPAPSGDGGAGGVWLQLRQCESGDNYQADTGNGFYGAYQFSPSTWTGMGYPGRPDQEPPAMQDQAAQRLQAQSGWGQWPACSAALGLH